MKRNLLSRWSPRAGERSLFGPFRAIGWTPALFSHSIGYRLLQRAKIANRLALWANPALPGEEPARSSALPADPAGGGAGGWMCTVPLREARGALGRALGARAARAGCAIEACAWGLRGARLRTHRSGKGPRSPARGAQGRLLRCRGCEARSASSGSRLGLNHLTGEMGEYGFPSRAW